MSGQGQWEAMVRRHDSGGLRWRLKQAQSLGYARGLADKHYESVTLKTGAEYRAWLAGWRAAQAELKAERAKAAAAAANTERIMRNLLAENDWACEREAR